jgi:hypothetical protein
MKLGQWIGMFVVSGSTACAGYWLRGHMENSGTFLAAKSLPPLDYVVVPESFSRIENARQTLQGLCSRLRLEMETRLCEQGRLRLQKEAPTETLKAQMNRIIRDLEDGMKEFEGTDQQLYVAEDLLCVLKREKRFNRWVELYLQAVYEQPMHPIVARFAAEAVHIGKLAGREDEVIAALTQLSNIPVNFQGKIKIEAVLISAKTANPLAVTAGPASWLKN